MCRRSSSSVRIFHPRLSSEEVIGLLRERLPKVSEELPFLEVGGGVPQGSRARGYIRRRLFDDNDGQGLKVEVVREIFASYGEELLGSFSVYQSGRLRIRRG